MLRKTIFLCIFSFVFLSLPSAWGADRGEILSGETKIGLDISPPLYKDTWNFNGQEGSHVTITAVTTSGALDTCITLYPPDGGPPEANTCGYCGITGGGDLLDHQLQKTGLYTIVVKDNCLSNSGTYNISFLKFPDPRGSEWRGYYLWPNFIKPYY